MKTPEEIAISKRIIIEKNDKEGGYGYLVYGALKNCTVIWGRNEGGKHDHVSVAPTGRTPTWEEMCAVKDIFFTDEEECYQVFPKTSEYVNLKKTCLHIWRDTATKEE